MRRSEVVNLLCKSLMIASTSCCWWHSIIVVLMDGFVSMLIQFLLTSKTTHYSLFKNWGGKKNLSFSKFLLHLPHPPQTSTEVFPQNTSSKPSKETSQQYKSSVSAPPLKVRILNPNKSL